MRMSGAPGPPTPFLLIWPATVVIGFTVAILINAFTKLEGNGIYLRVPDNLIL